MTRWSAALAALAVLASAAVGAAQDAPKFETRDPAIDVRTKQVERLLGSELRTAALEHVVVRGDHELPELARMADAVEKTFAHFLTIFGCTADEVLRPPRAGGATRIEVFQFRSEKGYLDFMDRVFARERDATVDQKRFDLMRRQKGFFVLTPRPLMAQYMGPSDFQTPLSAAVHKTSHTAMLLWKPAGTWMPWWFLEGLAAWQEMAILHESRTYCLEVGAPGDYARPGSPEADEAAKARMEASWRARVKKMATKREDTDLMTLGQRRLNELVLEDVIQSWSVVDWLHRHKHLREFAIAYKTRRDLAPALDDAVGLPPIDAQDQWRDWVLLAY